MRNFWLLHAALPAALFTLLVAIIFAAHLDVRTADAVFFDWGARRWIGADTWWATDLIHTGGRDLVRLVVLCALLVFAASFANKRRLHLRRGAMFVALGVLLSTGVVGLLKSLTNVDCPWDLERYGGSRPYVSLFGDRPDNLPRARCFPGAHSSSGFALMCFYFLLRDTRRRAAQWALAGGLLAGVVFAFGQQARGAHFLSHDLTSAALVWYVLLALYARLLKPRAARAIDFAPATVQQS